MSTTMTPADSPELDPTRDSDRKSIGRRIAEHPHLVLIAVLIVLILLTLQTIISSLPQLSSFDYLSGVSRKAEMNYRAPVRGTSLAQQAQDILTDRIKNGVYPSKSQIPPENELAAEFNVSRATIRSAISALVERGLIVRRHGIGTFVSQRSDLSNPLNEAIDFNELIAGNGFKPGIRTIKTRLLVPAGKILTALNLGPDQQVLQGYKIFTADQEPLIYCINSLPTMVSARRGSMTGISSWRSPRPYRCRPPWRGALRQIPILICPSPA